MKMVKRALLGGHNPSSRDEVVWNAVASTLNAGISAILVLVVTRINGENDAGIFSIAFAISQMMQMIGFWGMRNYQSTDAEEKFNFSTYLYSRVITSGIMVIVSVIYIGMQNYQKDKALVVVLLCLLRVSDSMNDVYEGMYQKHHRLDVGGRIWSYRVLIYTAVFTISLVLTNNLILACALLTVTSSITLLVSVYVVKDQFECAKIDWHDKNVYTLLKECFPLFIGSFLLVYISNAPKYAIDIQMEPKIQTYYTVLFMPCFVISLFAGFIIKPLLMPLSVKWYKKEKGGFLRLGGVLLGSTIGLTIGITIVGYLIGCEVLAWIYGIDLVKYKVEFTILLIGGGFSTLSNILQLLLTVMRKQKLLLDIFFLASIIAYIISPILVKREGITGAAYAYSITVGIMMLLFGGILCFCLIRQKWDS